MESERKGQDLFGSPGSSWVLITVGAPSGSWGLPGAPRGPRNLEGPEHLGVPGGPYKLKEAFRGLRVPRGLQEPQMCHQDPLGASRVC